MSSEETICHSRQMKETIELARLASLHEKPSAIPVQNYIILCAFRQGGGKCVACQSGKFCRLLGVRPAS